MKDSNRFFPSTIIEKKNVDSNTKNSKSFIFFKKHILYLIRPFTNSTFHCYDPKSLKKIITKLRLVLIHLRLYPFFFSRYNKFYLQLWCCWNNSSLYCTLSQLFKWEIKNFQQTSKYWTDENILFKNSSNISEVILFSEQ